VADPDGNRVELSEGDVWAGAPSDLWCDRRIDADLTGLRVRAIPGVWRTAPLVNRALGLSANSDHDDAAPAVEYELCHGTVREATLLELLEVGAATGFDAVTTTPVPYRDLVAEGVSKEEISVRVQESGVRVSYLDGLGSALAGVPPASAVPAQHRWVLEISEQEFYDIASVLGAPAVSVVHFYGRPTPLEVLAQSLHDAADRARQHGLRLLVEFIPGTGVPTLLAALDLIDASGADNVGIVLDSWHLANSRSWEDIQSDRALQAVDALQLSDALRAQRRNEHVPMVDRLLPGAGELPLRHLVDRMRATRPDVPLGVEVFSSALRARPHLEAAGVAARSLRSIVA
jgi:sugar phosphate isomerase/epimerase